MRLVLCVVTTAVLLLTALGCRADVERSTGEAPRTALAETGGSAEDYVTSAALMLLGVERSGKMLRARLRLQNLSKGTVTYQGCAAANPVWHWQRLDAGTWKEGGTYACDGSETSTHELAPGEAFKFDARLEPNQPPARIGVRVAIPATRQSALIWSETVWYDSESVP